VQWVFLDLDLADEGLADNVLRGKGNIGGKVENLGY
jgi:hypothetical protein